MHRRRFLHSLLQATAGCAGVRLGAPRILPARPARSQRPQVAVTIDDPSVELGSYMHWREANRRILSALHERGVQAALFVCGRRVDQPDGPKLLQEFNDAGHRICNHSYSHFDFNSPQTTYRLFVADFERDEPIVAPFSNRTKLFRYPFLKEGDTAEKRDGFRAFLKQRGYRVGQVTIDTSDWYVDQRMIEKLKEVPDFPKERYRDYLVAHLMDRAAFYRRLAVEVAGYEIPHTILLHYKTLNALFLPDVMKAFEAGGWEWIDAGKAFADPIFQREPKTLPAGESLLWALAEESGRFKGRLRYPGEDDTYEKPKMDALGL
jgi:peptidoglycan-N-acetylglucosamine deacetylase